MLYLLKTCCHGPLWRATFQPGHRCCLCFSAGADLVCLPCKIACHAEVNIVQMLLDSSSTIVLLFMMAAGSCKSAFTFKQEYSFLQNYFQIYFLFLNIRVHLVELPVLPDSLPVLVELLILPDLFPVPCRITCNSRFITRILILVELPPDL